MDPEIADVMDTIKCFEFDRTKLNQLIEEIVKERNKLTLANLANLSKGEKVCFFSSTRNRMVYGNVEKIGSKYIKVRESNGNLIWTVPPSLLERGWLKQQGEN